MCLPRVLHLIEPGSPHFGPCGLALAADLFRVGRDFASTALIVGGSSAERNAHEAGIETWDRVSSPTTLHRFNTGPLRRYLLHVGPFDLLHCWSPETLCTVAAVAPRMRKVLTLTMGPASAAAAHLLRTVSEMGGVTILTISNTVKRAWAAGGVDPIHMHILRPGLDFGRIDHAERQRLRDDWSVADSTLLLALLGEPAARLDGRRAGRILALTNLCGLDVVLLIPPQVARRSWADRLARGAECEDRLIVDDRADRLTDVLPACDASLILCDDTRQEHLLTPSPPHPLTPSPSPGLLPMLWSAAAGKPIIAEAGYGVTEVMENRRTALLTTPGDDEQIVERLRLLIADRRLAWSLADAARSEAFSFYSRSRFCSDTATVYGQIMEGESVRVPEIPVTGGLKFAAPSIAQSPPIPMGGSRIP